jgi:hypothetical protein
VYSVFQLQRLLLSQRHRPSHPQVPMMSTSDYNIAIIVVIIIVIIIPVMPVRELIKRRSTGQGTNRRRRAVGRRSSQRSNCHLKLLHLASAISLCARSIRVPEFARNFEFLHDHDGSMRALSQEQIFRLRCAMIVVSHADARSLSNPECDNESLCITSFSGRCDASPAQNRFETRAWT